MRVFAGMTALGVAVLAWIGAAGQQAVYPRPTEGPGVVTVTGTVAVGNTPSVNATQAGEWKVAVANAPEVHVANTPSVAVAAPEFLKQKRSYELTWPDGAREVIVVEQIGRDGWVRVGDERWVNLALARSLQARQ